MTREPSDADRELAEFSAQELQEAINVALDVAARVEMVTGVQIIQRKPGIMDAKRADVERMLAQVRAAERTFEQLLTWLGPNASIGRILKTVPAEVARSLQRGLADAGLLPSQEH